MLYSGTASYGHLLITATLLWNVHALSYQKTPLMLLIPTGIILLNFTPFIRSLETRSCVHLSLVNISYSYIYKFQVWKIISASQMLFRNICLEVQLCYVWKTSIKRFRPVVGFGPTQLSTTTSLILKANVLRWLY